MASRPQPRRVYLDVCALSRPFDDQTQARIRLETEAVELILSRVRQEDLQLIVSAAHAVEIAAIEDAEERGALERLLADLGHRPRLRLRAARERADRLRECFLMSNCHAEAERAPSHGHITAVAEASRVLKLRLFAARNSRAAQSDNRIAI